MPHLMPAMSHRPPHESHAEWMHRPHSMTQDHMDASSRAWWLAGLAAAGMVFLAWRHFGPDVRRYVKIESM